MDPSRCSPRPTSGEPMGLSSSRSFCPWWRSSLSSSSSICGASCRKQSPLGGHCSIRQDAVASLGAALLPLNRGLVFALVPIAIIDSCSKHRLISRRLWAAFFAFILLAAIAAKLLDPRLYDDRVSSPDNVYQRLAQHRETLRVVREYPFFGVGFGLYHDVAARNPRYMAKWNGIESMNYPAQRADDGAFGRGHCRLAVLCFGTGFS